MHGLQKDKTGRRLSQEWKNVEKLHRVNQYLMRCVFVDIRDAYGGSLVLFFVLKFIVSMSGYF